MLRVELGGARPRREPPPGQPIKRLESQLSVTLFECGGRRSRSRRPERCSSASAVRSSPKVGERPPPCVARRSDPVAPARRSDGVLHIGCVSSALYELIPAVLPRWGKRRGT